MSESRTFKAAFLGSGKFLVTFTALVSAAVLARILTKTEYAAYRQTLLAYRFVAPFLSMGLPMALYYFLPRDQKQGRSILTGNLFMLFVMGTLFFAVMWCGGNIFLAKSFKNPILSKLLLLFSPYALLILPVGAIGPCLVSSDKIKTLTFFNIISRAVVLVSVVWLALIFRSAYGAIMGTVVAEFFLFFPAIFLMYHAVTGNSWLPKKSNMWAQIKYSIPLGIASTIGNMHKNIDKILVSAMKTPEEFALYVNGAMDIPIIGIITGAVISILIPEFTKMYQNKEYQKILSLWHRAMLKCALLIFPFMFFLLSMAPEIMRLLYSAKYTASAKPFRIYLLLFPLRLTTFTSIFMISNNNLLIVYDTIISLALNFILSLMLITFIGSNGAALSTVIVSYIWDVPYCLFFIRKILNVDIKNILPYRRIMNILIINILATIILIPKFFIKLSDLTAVITFSCLYGLSVSLLYWRNIWIYLQRGKIKFGAL